MGSRLSWHIQQPDVPPWLAEHIRRARPKFVKMIDPPPTDPFGGATKVIGRCWIGGDDVERELIRKGAKGAEEYFARLRDFYISRRWVEAWEGPNEPWIGDEESRGLLNAFSARWAELMAEHGWKAIVLSLSVGWPSRPEDILDFRGALDAAWGWSVHEYSAPRMDVGQGWYCLRYRKTARALAEHLGYVPPLFITECGIDGGTIHTPQQGWKRYAKDEVDYMAQLAWYDSELQKDDYVQVATVFTATPTWEWRSFEITKELSELLMRHICESRGKGEKEVAKSKILWPITPAEITQAFGENPDYYQRYGLKGHNGIDLVPPIVACSWEKHGWPVYAVADGRAVMGESEGYGLYVYIYHDGFDSLYAHLAEAFAMGGKEVKAGELIGRMGYSGNTVPRGNRGTHLHFAIRPKPYRLQNGYRGYVDPMPWLEARNGAEGDE